MPLFGQGATRTYYETITLICTKFYNKGLASKKGGANRYIFQLEVVASLLCSFHKQQGN